MPRMYHPRLRAEITVPDDDGCIAAHTESGWVAAPEPVQTHPGLVAEPVEYAPVQPKPKPKGKTGTADAAPSP